MYSGRISLQDTRFKSRLASRAGSVELHDFASCQCLIMDKRNITSGINQLQAGLGPKLCRKMNVLWEYRTLSPSSINKLTVIHSSLALGAKASRISTQERDIKQYSCYVSHLHYADWTFCDITTLLYFHLKGHFKCRFSSGLVRYLGIKWSESAAWESPMMTIRSSSKSTVENIVCTGDIIRTGLQGSTDLWRHTCTGWRFTHGRTPEWLY